MNFCKVCQNLLYIKTEDEGGLVNYCKCCKYSHTDKAVPGKAICVSKTLYAEDDLLYAQHNNQFLRFDPTLPRVEDPNIRCPNGACTGDPLKPNIIYVKYHAVHMKYFYTCNYCGESWRNNQNQA